MIIEMKLWYGLLVARISSHWAANKGIDKMI